jgi:hypothetical protein
VLGLGASTFFYPLYRPKGQRERKRKSPYLLLLLLALVSIEYQLTNKVETGKKERKKKRVVPPFKNQRPRAKKVHLYIANSAKHITDITYYLGTYVLSSSFFGGRPRLAPFGFGTKELTHPQASKLL